MKWTHYRDLALTTAFLGCLYAPWVDEVVRDDEARGPKPELREPAERPAPPTSLEAAARWPSKYEPHFLDTFGLRDVLLRSRGLLYWFGLGVSPTDSIVRGKDGWIYTAINASRAVHRGTDPMSAYELQLWCNGLEQRARWLESMGVRYLYVVAPNKETIYPEHLPESWAPLSEHASTRLDQFASAIAQRDVEFLDLRPTLRAAKAQDRRGDEVITRLGTHWNGHGSMAAYRAIIERVRQWFPAVQPLSDDQISRLYNPYHGDTWGSHLYINDLLPQREWFLVHEGGPRHEIVASHNEPVRTTATRKPSATGPRVLMFHDSFGPYIQALMAEAFPHALFLWQPKFDPLAVLAAQPDLVIDFYVERAFTSVEHLRDIDYSAAVSRLAPHEQQRLVWSTQGSGLRSERDGSDLPRLANGGFAVQLDARTRGALLPVLQADATQTLELLLEGQAPEDATIDIYTRAEGAKEYKRLDRVSVEVRKGPFLKLAVLPALAERREVLLRWSTAQPMHFDYLEARLPR